MKKSLLFIFFISMNVLVFAQSNYEVSGTVKDSSGQSVIAASIKLIMAKDTLFTRSNADGFFKFSNVKSGQFLLSVTSLGFQSANRRYLFKDGEGKLQLDPITLKASSKELNEVVISGTPTVTVKEDTVEYRASDYKLKEDAQVEDLLKKLPGVEVDQNGNVKAQGKQITRVRVNGKDFFGGDVKTATQQLPANLIDKVQIVDDYGDQANFTGIKEGDPEKILNIQIRPDKNTGYFARGTIGQGNEDRYQGNLSANYFKDKQQISVLANLNNTNTSLFNFSGGGGGARIQIGGGGGGNVQVFGGNRGGGGGGTGGDGITEVGSIGLNYRDEWGSKISSYGNYSYANRDNNVLRTILQQNVNAGGVINNNQNTDNNTNNINHRLNWNIEYRIDSLNYLKITPYFNLAKSSGNNNAAFQFLQNGTQLNSEGTNIGKNRSETPNFGAEVLFNHRFAKRGRTASINLSVNRNIIDQDDNTLNESVNYPSGGGSTNLYQEQQIAINNNNTTTRSGISFIEPLSRTSSIEFNWNFSYAKYHNSRETFGTLVEGGSLALKPDQSNDFSYYFMTNRLGFNYRVNQKKFNYALGLGLQPTLLSGSSLTNQTSSRRSALYVVPVARYSYNFSRTRAFNASYNGRNNEPSFSQLQPVTDLSNPQFPVVGNPNLRAEFTHNINLRYNNYNFDKGDVLFTNLSANFSQNRIVSNTLFLSGNRIETRYLNTNGFYNVNFFYTWSKPLAERKYTISFNGSANYTNNVNFIDNEKNIGKNSIFSQGASFQINPKEWLELSPGINYTLNRNNYSLASQPNTKVSNWNATFNGKIYLWKTWLLGGDFIKTINQGYSGALAVNPFIMNAYLEKQFLKNKAGALRLQIFDVYNENTSVSRSVTGNSITDTRSNRLARYALLTFSLKLQKFNGQAPNNMNMQMPGQGGMMIRRDMMN